MKTKAFAALARQLLPSLPGMVIHGPMMLVVPLGQVLRGLYFEGSSFDAKSLYVWLFWLPLYVPTETAYFNLGKRLRDESGGDRWNMADAQFMEGLTKSVRAEAIPFLKGLDTPQGVVEAARRAAATSKDPYTHQALCYALAKAGKVQEAVTAVDVLLGLLSPAIPWQAELGTRANLLKEKLIASAEDTTAMLEGWTAESIRQLKLEDIS